MANVIDTSALKFVREQVRPLCEEARALNARIVAMQTTWNAGMSAIIGSSGTDKVVENRTDEGVPDLTSLQVAQAVGSLLAMLAASNSEIVSVPCVRPLEVSSGN